MTETLFGESSAVLSECQAYRYRLRRVWDEAKGLVLWIMLNPSTADAHVDDPTIRRCIRFTRDWGFGGLEVRNLFALRATDPSELRSHPQPVGPGNVIVPDDPGEFALYVAAWGAHGSLQNRSATIRSAFEAAGVPLHCLGTTKAGEPRHPLYLASNTQPINMID